MISLRRLPGRRLLVSCCALLMLAGTAGTMSLMTTSPALATGNLELIQGGGATIGNRVWPSTMIPLTWNFFDPNGAAPSCTYSSTSAPVAQLLNAVQQSFNAWENLVDSSIDFTYGGTTTVRNPGLNFLSGGFTNGSVNLVTFCSSTAFASGVLAVTPSTAIAAPATVVAGGGCAAGKGPLALPGGTICYPAGSYEAGTMVDADTDVNTSGTSETQLTTNGTHGRFDVRSLMTHELGHFFGLSHDPLFHATMYPFIDDEPASDGLGQDILKTTDASTAGRYHPAATYSTNLGTITGTIFIDGAPAHGVHVVAVDPSSLLGVAGRFSISVFEDPNALGPEGMDFLLNGEGFYRIDGLPAGNYHVMTEYFDDSDFISGRLANRYNTTVFNSNIAAGIGDPNQQAPTWLGFLPRLIEFYDTAAAGFDSGIAGDGNTPGTAVDNSDAASLVSVTAGAVTSGIDININIEPSNGQLPADRENPTTREVIRTENVQPSDRITVFLLNGGNNDIYAAFFPSSLLPAPPYNIAEGIWMRAGRSTLPFVNSLAYDDPNLPGTPNLDDLLIASAGRVLSGGPNGSTAAGDFIDVRDQFNFTVNQAQDLYVLLRQPESPGGISFITQGFFNLVTCVPSGPSCASNRVGRTLVTEDGGGTWGTITNGDIFYDLILERDPPVMITGTDPNIMTETFTEDIDILGTGFRSGATVSFGPDVTVNNVTYISPTVLRANITPDDTAALVTRPINVTVQNPEVVFPNVARVFNLAPFIDSDSDGEQDATDCAPGNMSLKKIPVEVSGVAVASLGGFNVDVSWTSQDPSAGSGTIYDVVTGTMGPAGVNPFPLSTCAANNHPDTPLNDATALAPGGIQYWLVRATNGCPGAGPGSYGVSSPPTNFRLPLDGGVPCAN